MTKTETAQAPAQHACAKNGLVKSLGWFSVGLGLTQLITPRLVSRMIGIRAQPGRMRAMGVRELTAGIGILASSRPGPWLWGRAGGDFIDLAMLGASATSRRTKTNRLAGAMAAVAGVTLLDALAVRHSARSATV